MKESADLIRQVVSLWHAHRAWANELIDLALKREVLRPGQSGQIPGTNWFYQLHGAGIDIYKSPDVGGIDFDFDKPAPDAWRLKIFLFRQLNDGALPYSVYKQLIDDEELLDKTIKQVLSEA